MTAPIVLDAAHLSAHTPWRHLIEEIRDVFTSATAVSPERAVHQLDLPDGTVGSLLVMPGWIAGDVIVVKAVTYVPGNAGTPVPTINAGALLFDADDGRLLAHVDGDELTARRTAATSALAADALARRNASRLLVIGTGRLCPYMVRAHREVRELDAVEIWGRDRAAAEDVADRLTRSGLPVRAVSDLPTAVAGADIVSCVTGSSDPVVHGVDVRRGAHLDLVGSFRPDMRECDDAAIASATLFVDTVAGAMRSGDLQRPIANGSITEASVVADLRALVTGEHPGRTDVDEITAFKSAGSALADLAAARLAWRGHRDATK